MKTPDHLKPENAMQTLHAWESFLHANNHYETSAVRTFGAAILAERNDSRRTAKAAIANCVNYTGVRLAEEARAAGIALWPATIK